MKKTIVVYKSKTGFTERYANWIAERLNCSSQPIDSLKIEDLKDYGLIIYGGGLIAGQIMGIGKIKNWMEKEPKKTWVVFATGTTPPSQAYTETIQKTNFRTGEARPAHFYYMLSGLNYEKMGFFSRLLMTIFTRVSEKKAAKESGKPIQKPGKPQSIDLCHPSYIDTLVSYVELKRR